MKFFAAAAVAVVSASEYNPRSIELDVKTWGNEISFTISSPEKVVCSGGPFAWHDTHPIDCTLDDGAYTLNCIDSYGDGWHGGFMTIDGKKFCEDFRDGHSVKHTFRVGGLAAETISHGL